MQDPINILIQNTWTTIRDLIIWVNRVLGIPSFLDAYALSSVKALLLLGLISLDIYFIIWMERKLLGRIHHRRSITETGPAGILQNIADFLKFIVKEDIIPKNADKFFHYATPILFIALAFLPLTLIPFAPGLWIANIDASLIAILAINSLLPGIVICAGWAGGSKFSLIGAFRSGLLMVAYEIPMVLSALSVILLSSSLNLVQIIEAQQSVWFVVILPLGALIFLISSIMEMERGPFDISEAESELTVGWRTEFTGIKFALFYAGQYAQVFVAASLFTILFLGGWNGPFLHPLIWFLIKVHLVIILLVLVRVTYFRPRPDQVVKIGFKWLIPLSVINLFYTLLIAPYAMTLI